MSKWNETIQRLFTEAPEPKKEPPMPTSNAETKMTLQELLPDCELLTVAACIARLGWTTEHPPSDERGTGTITCACGSTVKVGGWFGTEHAWCPSCGAGMQDMTGMLPAGRSSASHIDYDKVTLPEDGAVWIPENVWGFR